MTRPRRTAATAGRHWIILLTDRAAEPGTSIRVYGCRRGKDYAGHDGEPLADLRDAVFFCRHEHAEKIAASFMAENPRWLATVVDAPAFPDSAFVGLDDRTNDPRRN